jgi:hypothetical protein
LPCVSSELEQDDGDSGNSIVDDEDVIVAVAVVAVVVAAVVVVGWPRGMFAWLSWKCRQSGLSCFGLECVCGFRHIKCTPSYIKRRGCGPLCRRCYIRCGWTQLSRYVCLNVCINA